MVDLKLYNQLNIKIIFLCCLKFSLSFAQLLIVHILIWICACASTNKNYSSLTLRTRSLPLFTEYYKLFYLNGVKVIPNNIGDLLTPLGLAHWIMQDGSYHKVSKGVVLCTDSFKKEEIELLISVLQTNFNLICTIQKAPNKSLNRFRIYISAKSLPVLRTLVQSHFHPTMLYKLGI